MGKATAPERWENHEHRLERQIQAINATLEEIIMSTGDMQSAEQRLQTDVTQVQQDEATLRSTVTTQIADIAAEVANLRGQVGDPAVLNNLDQMVQALHTSLGQDQAQVAASDPGAPPTPPAPPAPPAPASATETTAPSATGGTAAGPAVPEGQQ